MPKKIEKKLKKEAKKKGLTTKKAGAYIYGTMKKIGKKIGKKKVSKKKK